MAAMTQPPVSDQQLADLTERLQPGYVSPERVASFAERLRLEPVPEYVLADDSVSLPDADRLLLSRRMTAVRAVLMASRDEALSLLGAWRDGEPDVRGAVLGHLDLLEDALREVHHAERGCGQPDGDCLDPCHLGILAPDDHQD